LYIGESGLAASECWQPADKTKAIATIMATKIRMLVIASIHCVAELIDQWLSAT
jgi:hypothetical protein